jgi:molybdenum cofactor biosynthesis protein A
MPEEGIQLKRRDEILSFDDIERLVRIAAGLGVNKVRITGGEPLVRKDLPMLIQRIASIDGIEKIGMTTNGVLLGRYLPELAAASVSSLNISLDTLKPERFRNITRTDNFEIVYRNIEAALQSGIPQIKLNVVVLAGMNSDELLDFVEYARSRPLTVRFIEYMPFKSNGWDSTKLVSYAEMKAKIEQQYTLTPILDADSNASAKLFQIPDWAGKIGFITAMSSHFCDSCNRLRVTADGGVKSCLFLPESVNIRTALRSGADEEVSELLHRSLSGKPKEHFSIDTLKEIITNPMVQIGG